MSQIHRILLTALLGLFLSTSLMAQSSPPPPSDYTGSISAGIALTGGNTDTTNLNIALALVRDLKTRNVIKLNGLYLRGDQNNALTVDKSSVNLRDEYTLSGRTFLFGQADYFRDRFKEINYLVSPTAGAGYKLLVSDNRVLLVDGGAGAVWEKNLGLPVKTSGAVTAGERFSNKISPTLTLTQSLANLFKMDDFGDSLSNFSVGATTTINKRLDMKVEFLDTFKNKPPRSGIKKNDTAFITALVVKFQ